MFFVKIIYEVLRKQILTYSIYLISIYAFATATHRNENREPPSSPPTSMDSIIFPAKDALVTGTSDGPCIMHSEVV